jgi:hypothetical protein
MAGEGQMSKLNLIYVVGLARSGSTYFSSFLAETLGGISLGEIITNIEIYSDEHKRQLYRAEGRKCTCGVVPESCEFWGRFVGDMESGNKNHAHHKILATTKDEYPESIIIDTSKTTQRLSEFYMRSSEIQDLSINIILLNIVRHYAGQVTSYQKYHRAEETKGIEATTLSDAYTWLNKNRKNLAFLRDSPFPSKTIMYEDLIFRSDEIKAEISSFVNSHFTQYEKREPLIHEIGGNEGFKAQHGGGIRYDTAWMYNRKLSLLSPLLAPVIYCNTKWHHKYQPGAK